MDVYKTAVSILSKLKDNGFETYFVGGFVRDKLLGNNSCKDIDIVTSATPNEIIDIFPHTYKIGIAFGIVNVIENGLPFEVATFREEDNYKDGRHPEQIKYTKCPQLDALRRDFTINAIYYDPINDKIYDYTEGLNDIKRGILRTIGIPEQRFKEDYLRILRAIRFSNRFGFKLDSKITETIPALAPNLRYLSWERIRDEINKILIGNNPDKAFLSMYKLGILDIILPEISAMLGVQQPKEYHPEGDVFTHTMLMLKNMTWKSLELAWAILLHDVAKPPTFAFNEKGKECFYCHDAVGEKISIKIMERFKHPNKLVERVSFAVKNHMRFANVVEMKKAKCERLIAADTFPLELELHRLDCISSNGFNKSYLYILDTVIAKKGIRELPYPLLSGKELIELGLKPGKNFGLILNELQEKQLEGILKEKQDAIDWVKRSFK